MPAVTRKGDQCTGHDSCPGVPLVSFSPDVFANKLNVGRVLVTPMKAMGVSYTPHTQIISRKAVPQCLPMVFLGDVSEMQSTLEGLSQRAVLMCFPIRRCSNAAKWFHGYQLPVSSEQ